jgi:hypothetical protein
VLFKSQISESRWSELVESLFKEHYDPKTLHYWKSHHIAFIEEVHLKTLQDEEVDKLLDYLQLRQYQWINAVSCTKSNDQTFQNTSQVSRSYTIVDNVQHSSQH